MAVNTGVNELVLDEVFGLYTAAEQIMLQKIANRIKRGATIPGWNEQKLNEMQAMRLELERALGNIRGTVTPGITKSILSSYIAGMNTINKSLKLPATALKDTQIPYHVQRMVMEANGIIQGASVQILRNANDIYKAVVTDSASVMLTGVETRLDASQRALNVFAAKGITGFVDKAGRRWEMGSYVEMAVRTVSARAALQGHIDRSTELGHDLMVVSQFGKTCPICAPWEGKPISISGSTPGYPSLALAKSSGLFHPNCKHTLLAYFPGITELPEREPNDDLGYKQIQEQRYNERQIRSAKRLEAAAMSPQAAQKAKAKVLHWQNVQRELMKETGLSRKYKREGIKNRTGNAAKAMFGRHTLELDSGQPLIDPNGFFKPPVLPNRNKPKSPVKPKPVVIPPAPVVKPKVEPKLKKSKITFDKIAVKIFDAGDKVRSELITMAGNLPDHLQKSVEKVQGKISLKVIHEPGAYYQPMTKLIVVDLKADKTDKRGMYSTFFHELGHAIDHDNGYISKKKSYVDAMMDDYDSTVAIWAKHIPQVLSNKLKDTGDIGNGIQDIFGGLSAGKYKGKWGHSEEYWSRGNRTHEASSELFAHMVSAATDPERVKLMEQWFPAAWKAFNDIMVMMNK